MKAHQLQKAAVSRLFPKEQVSISIFIIPISVWAAVHRKSNKFGSKASVVTYLRKRFYSCLVRVKIKMTKNQCLVKYSIRPNSSQFLCVYLCKISQRLRFHSFFFLTQYTDEARFSVESFVQI